MTVTQPSIETLLQEITAKDTGTGRVLVAIAGAPGSGKTTLADTLAQRLGPQAAVLPMDGFHLDNADLIPRGLLERKGAPETFDADGFIALIQRLRTEDDVSYPTFDRSADRTVPNGGHIAADTRIVVIEGNYLLLTLPPWHALSALFDLTIRLDVDHAELEKRLIARWLSYGLSAEQARARALGNDMRNVRVVEANSSAPDLVVRP
ncbi:pantothenate kinase [Rubricella aquisinus]|uniref:Pantothenate kinase n=1 Tax=Rubricella aquisinus TaxID=2028108 RepID=A0A840X450_9RHOB|nr:nucleoside triphosphate hydrolase [Rubricella aquisinus]MBB5516615.1 pantothenate kinase [Rubricella aquisinus]